MTDDDRELHPKDRIPPEEGIVIPADELHLVNDDAPTEGVDPVTHEGDLPPKRPTDGPL